MAGIPSGNTADNPEQVFKITADVDITRERRRMVTEGRTLGTGRVVPSQGECLCQPNACAVASPMG